MRRQATRVCIFRSDFYWGPGESGKTTNNLWIKRKLGKFQVSPGFSIQTTQKRTLWADAVWLCTKIDAAGQHLFVMWQVVKTTRQERFPSTREFVLVGADEAVFVADATLGREYDNLRSFKQLLGLRSGAKIPIIVQLNKTNVSDSIAAARLARVLEIPASKIHPSVAVNGEGVIEVFNGTTGEVLQACFKKSLSTIKRKTIPSKS